MKLERVETTSTLVPIFLLKLLFISLLVIRDSRRFRKINNNKVEKLRLNLTRMYESSIVEMTRFKPIYGLST